MRSQLGGCNFSSGRKPLGTKPTLPSVTQKDLHNGRLNLDSILESRDNGPFSQSFGFSSHVRI